MALSVKVNLEGYPQGIPVGIVGVGVVENGGTVEVDPGMEPVFHSINGDTIENVMKDQEGMEVSGSAEWTPEEAPATPEPTPTPTPPSTQSGLPPNTTAPTEEGA